MWQKILCFKQMKCVNVFTNCFLVSLASLMYIPYVRFYIRGINNNVSVLFIQMVGPCTYDTLGTLQLLLCVPSFLLHLSLNIVVWVLGRGGQSPFPIEPRSLSILKDVSCTCSTTTMSLKSLNYEQGPLCSSIPPFMLS